MTALPAKFSGPTEPEDAPPGSFRVPVEDLRLKPNIPAGMDLAVVAAMIPRLRKTAQDWEPIVVQREADGFRVLDGRHRFFAAVIAGRPDVLAVEET